MKFSSITFRSHFLHGTSCQQTLYRPLSNFHRNWLHHNAMLHPPSYIVASQSMEIYIYIYIYVIRFYSIINFPKKWMWTYLDPLKKMKKINFYERKINSTPNYRFLQFSAISRNKFEFRNFLMRIHKNKFILLLPGCQIIISLFH